MQNAKTTTPDDIRWTDEGISARKVEISEQPHEGNVLKVIVDSLSQAPELDRAITDALAETMQALGADGGSLHTIGRGGGGALLLSGCRGRWLQLGDTFGLQDIGVALAQPGGLR